MRLFVGFVRKEKIRRDVRRDFAVPWYSEIFDGYELTSFNGG
jgi:hypothetical protein